MKREMKWLAIALALVLMLTACSVGTADNGSDVPDNSSNSGNSDDPGESSEVKVLEPNAWADQLESNPTTGYSWEVIYQSYNLVVDDMTYTQSETDDPDVVGVGGYDYLEFHVEEGDRAILILEYSQTWEPGIPACYKSYTVTMENGEIEDVKDYEWWCYDDCVEASCAFDSGVLMAWLMSDYDFESYEENGECGIKITMRGQEGAVRIFHADSYDLTGLSRGEETFVITDTQYKLGFDENDVLVYLYSPDKNIYCLADGAGWVADYQADLIEFVEAAYWTE